MVPSEDEGMTAEMANYITPDGTVEYERLLKDNHGELSVEDLMVAFIEKSTQDIVDLRVELKNAKQREEEIKMACKDIRRELVNVEITNDLLDTQLFEAEEREQIWYEMIQEEKSVIALQNCYSELRYNEASMLLPMGNGYKPVTTREEREILGMGLKLSSSDTELTKEARYEKRSDSASRPRSAAQLTFNSDYGPIMSMEFPGPGKCPIPRINDKIIPQPRDASRASFRSLSPLEEIAEENEESSRISPQEALVSEMEMSEENDLKRSPVILSGENDILTEPTPEDGITDRNVDKQETEVNIPTSDNCLLNGQSSDESQVYTIETANVSKETMAEDGNEEITSDAASAKTSGDLILSAKSDSFEAERKSHADDGYVSQISEKVSEQGDDVISPSMARTRKKSPRKLSGKPSADSFFAVSVPAEVARGSSPVENDKRARRSPNRGMKNIPAKVPSPPEGSKDEVVVASGLKNVQNERRSAGRMASRSMTSSISITNVSSGLGLSDGTPSTPSVPSGSSDTIKAKRRNGRLSKEAADDDRRIITPLAFGSVKALPPVEPLEGRISRSPTKSPALRRESFLEIGNVMSNDFRRAIIDDKQEVSMEVQVEQTTRTSITEKKGKRLVSPQYIERAASPSLPEIQRERKEQRLSARKKGKVDEKAKPGPKVVDLSVPSYGIAGDIAYKVGQSPTPRNLNPNAKLPGLSTGPTNEKFMGENAKNQNLNSKRVVRKYIDIDDKPVKLKKRNAREKEQISRIHLDSKGKAGRKKHLKVDGLENVSPVKPFENVVSGHGLGSREGIHLPVIGKEKRNTEINLKHIPSPPQAPKPGRRRSFLPSINKK